MKSPTAGARTASALPGAVPFPLFVPPQRVPETVAAPASRPPVADAAPRRVRRARHVAGGVLLALAAVTSVAAAVVVVLWQVAFVPVLSPSMEPAFGAGDLVLTRQIDAADVAPGQVVVLPVADAGGERFVHRVVEVRRVDGSTVVRTKGDANAVPDPWTLRITSAKVPLVVADVPNAAALPMRLRDDGSRLVLLGLVVLLIGVGVKRALFR